MENASKALLIAAAVLIVLLIIAMGMNIFNSTDATTDQVEVTMTTTEISTFNNKFTSYLGTNKSAANAKSLANVVISNNAVETTEKQVSITIGGGTAMTSATTITNEIAKLSGRGTISATVDENTGRITGITLTGFTS